MRARLPKFFALDSLRRELLMIRKECVLGAIALLAIASETSAQTVVLRAGAFWNVTSSEQPLRVVPHPTGGTRQTRQTAHSVVLSLQGSLEGLPMALELNAMLPHGVGVTQQDYRVRQAV